MDGTLGMAFFHGRYYLRPACSSPFQVPGGFCCECHRRAVEDLAKRMRPMIKDYRLHFPPVLITEQEQVLCKSFYDFVQKKIMPLREQLEGDTTFQNKAGSFQSPGYALT
jgi:hypothetical protein